MRLDVAVRELVDGDARVYLTKSEFAIISALASSLVTPIDRIIYAMHGDEETEDAHNVIKVMVHRMRRKFRDAGMSNVILTVWGRGYKLARPIEMDCSAVPITIPAEHRATLERLLFSHPDQAAADRVLASFVGG